LVSGDDRHVTATMPAHLVEYMRYLFGAFGNDKVGCHDISDQSFPDILLRNEDAFDDVAFGKNAGQTVLVEDGDSADVLFGHVLRCLKNGLIDDGCKKRSSLNEIAHSTHAIFPIWFVG
jgi:hypothetical protein